ncbi:LacI family DNA-binding transcriptional regulator [Cognatishimia maritima]|uniref:Transcriptional regulator, LacI family n=1 Tax=Cognatishimia maritima TaxID=870908 RepID=A0A1M5JXW0_9RHOB|nr:LacI family DNA-binding transcriptional regulator [Cognatishimia maritima]SHG45396.1 transcriptional regulator, LacI family [Cognatishimia maritima]
MAKSQSAPTLEDVAKAAGVSTATVSRCLNDPNRVIEATRKRVMAAVDQLGYTPNFAARAMAAKRSLTIGAVIPTMNNAIFARALQAFQDQLAQAGYMLLVGSSAYDPVAEREQIRNLVARGVDGILLVGFEREPETYDYLKRHGVPTVAAWTYSEDGPVPSVGFDNHLAMQSLTEAVLSYGHQRIGFIAGKTEGNDRAKGRVDGVIAALAAAGIPRDQLILREADYDISAGAIHFREMMDAPHPPTVILCGNDVIAAGAMRQASRMGLSVPGDVSITGFDDMELAQIITPALTTVYVPHDEMGQRAARTLLQQIEGAEDVASVKLATKIVFRASLAKPTSVP